MCLNPGTVPCRRCGLGKWGRGRAEIESRLEHNYEGTPMLNAICGVGQIVRYQSLPDGRSNMIVQGLGRLRLTKDVVGQRGYRVGRGELMELDPIHQDTERRIVASLKLSAAQLMAANPETNAVLTELQLGDTEMSEWMDKLAHLFCESQMSDSFIWNIRISKTEGISRWPVWSRWDKAEVDGVNENAVDGLDDVVIGLAQAQDMNWSRNEPLLTATSRLIKSLMRSRRWPKSRPIFACMIEKMPVRLCWLVYRKVLRMLENETV